MEPAIFGSEGFIFATWRFFHQQTEKQIAFAPEGRMLAALGLHFQYLPVHGSVVAEVDPESITRFNIFYPQKYVVFSPLKALYLVAVLSRALLRNV